MRKGLVIKSISGEYTVTNKDETIICKPRGVFRHNDETVKVGDYVEYSPKEKTITKVFPRKNDLVRPVIANVDLVLVVTSVTDPDLNLNLLDKLISVIEYNNIKPILVFTKTDLLKDNHSYINIVNYYKQIGYDIIIKGQELAKDDLNTISEMISGKIAVLAGQSGVGKSTLLNLIDEKLKLKTDIISEALGRGKHTTRHIELFPMQNGYIADSPGFGNVGFDEIDNQTLSQTFIEFYQNSNKCFYHGCCHINEPKCYIKKLVSENLILKSRYDNYLSFIKELEETRKKKY